MYQNSEIDSYDYFLNKECRTPILYLLLKIHKGKTPPGRSIISVVVSHTEKISQFGGITLSMLVQKESPLISEIQPFTSSLYLKRSRTCQNTPGWSLQMLLHFTQSFLTFLGFMQPKKPCMNSDQIQLCHWGTHLIHRSSLHTG